MVKRQVFIATMEKVYSKVSVAMPLGYNDLFAESYCSVKKFCSQYADERLILAMP